MTSRAGVPAAVITDRLVLRLWSLLEVGGVVERVRSVDWADDFPAEGDRAVAGLFDQNPDWFDVPHGQRLIIERDSGLVVGSIGLFWPPSEGTLEIGYGVVASRRGRGYATEATRALTDFALTAPGVHTVFAEVELSNPASVRVLEKAGFRREDAAEDGTARFRVTATGRGEHPDRARDDVSGLVTRDG